MNLQHLQPLMVRLEAARERLRAGARPLIQAAVATPIAWMFAQQVLEHQRPIFAPISAIVAIGATVAQPWQRAAEIVIGVAIGVGVADLLALATGQGAWQIGVFVLLAMAVSMALGGGPLFVIQAGTAAVLVAALPTADGAASLDRVIDSLVGGVVALVFTILVLPVRPLALAHRSAEPVLEELAVTFEMVGEALRRCDEDMAEQALQRARRTGEHWARLDDAVGIGKQAVRIAPVRRHEQVELLDMAASVVQLDYAIRDARVLARVALRLTETGFARGARIELSMVEFATAARAIGGHLGGEYDATLLARSSALRATRLAAGAISADDDLALTHLVGQVRSTTVDVLRATGMDRGDAIAAMLEAVAIGLNHPG